MDVLGFEKLIYHHEKIEKLRRGEPQFPVHATISLGNFCNHRCLWCTAYEYQQSKAKLMDFDLLVGWLDRAARRGLKAVGYVGNGEPTAYPRFDELVRKVNELGLEQGMFTNGYLLDRHEDAILDYFTYIRVSLDAGSPEMHAAMHDVPASHFPRIMDNLRSMVKRRRTSRPTLGIQYAVHHRNLSDLLPSAILAAEIGVDYFSIKPVFNRGSVGERIDKNQITVTELTPIVARVRQATEAGGLDIHYRPHQVLSEAADHNVLKYDRCVAGFFNVNLYEDGQVVYCGPHRVPVSTMEEDLALVEQRALALCERIDLSRCPGGCRYHALNHLVDTVLHPERAADFHINFL